SPRPRASGYETVGSLTLARKERTWETSEGLRLAPTRPASCRRKSWPAVVSRTAASVESLRKIVPAPSARELRTAARTHGLLRSRLAIACRASRRSKFVISPRVKASWYRTLAEKSLVRLRSAAHNLFEGSPLAKKPSANLTACSRT